MDRLSAMEAFARVAEDGSFSQAARRLGVSKSRVSKLVMALENRLGVRLINRTTRRLSLTEVGAAYYEWCARITADAEEADRAATELHSEPRGVLKVNAPMSFGHSHLAPAIPAFLAAHPDVRVELTLNDRYIDLVDDGFDLAIRVGRLADSSLVARKLATAHAVVCATPGYFRDHGVPGAPEDLADHNCLLYSYLATADTWHFVGPERDHAVTVGGNFQANNGDALYAAACQGFGIALQPTFIVGEALRSGVLRTALDAYRSRDAGIYAVYPHNRHLSAKVRVFVDFLAARIGDRPYWDEALAV